MSDGEFLGYFYLHASDTTRHSNKLNTYLYPGLFFCSKEVDIPLQHEGLMSVLFRPAFIYTNRDRIEHFDNPASLQLGNFSIF
jgi:hypothetical protein